MHLPEDKSSKKREALDDCPSPSQLEEPDGADRDRRLRKVDQRWRILGVPRLQKIERSGRLPEAYRHSVLRLKHSCNSDGGLGREMIVRKKERTWVTAHIELEDIANLKATWWSRDGPRAPLVASANSQSTYRISDRLSS